VHGGLQAEQQVGEPGLAGTWQVVLQVAALLSQVRFAGLGQRVAHPVVLGNQLLPCGQCITALVVEVGGGRNVCMMKIFLCISEGILTNTKVILVRVILWRLYFSSYSQCSTV